MRDRGAEATVRSRFLRAAASRARAAIVLATSALALTALAHSDAIAKNRGRQSKSENAMQRAMQDAEAAQERALKDAEEQARQAEAQQRAMEEAQRRAIQAQEEAQRRMEAQQRAAEEAQRRAEAQQRAAEEAQRRAQQAADLAQRQAEAQQRAAEAAQRRAQQAADEAARRADAQQRAAEAAQSRAQQAADEAQRKAQQAAQDAAARAAAAQQKAAEDAQRKAQQAADEAQRRAQQAADQPGSRGRDQQTQDDAPRQPDVPPQVTDQPRTVEMPKDPNAAAPADVSDGGDDRSRLFAGRDRAPPEPDDRDRRGPKKAIPQVVTTPAIVEVEGTSASSEAASSSSETKSSSASEASGDKDGQSVTTTASGSSGGRRAAAPDVDGVKAWEPEREIVASGLSAAQAADLKALGFAAAPPVSLAGVGTIVQRLQIPSGMSRDEAQAVLTRQMPLTRFAPNHAYKIFSPQEGTDDLSSSGSGCRGSDCFPVSLIKWDARLGSCTSGVKIGIIDTSFDTRLPIFAKIKSSHGEFLNGEAPTQSDWHGTAVLSLLAGDPQNGIPGLVPDASFYLATAFRTDEHGNASTDTVRLLAALDWLDQLGVSYINMSFSGPRDALVEAAIRRMHKKGVVFIAAAGNQGPTAPPSYPAAYPEVIAVTAVNRNGENYRHANRGTYIDFAAPGVDVLASQPGGAASLRTGTSFAAPFVTAIVATRRDASLAKGAILADLHTQDLGPPGRDPIYGQGLALAPATCGHSPSVASAAAPRGNETPAAKRAPQAARPALASEGASPSPGLGGSVSISGGTAPAVGPMSFGSAFAP